MTKYVAIYVNAAAGAFYESLELDSPKAPLDGKPGYTLHYIYPADSDELAREKEALRSRFAAAALGRKGGRANTAAQQAARRANGAKGGRPAKYRVEKEKIRDGLIWTLWRYQAAQRAYIYAGKLRTEARCSQKRAIERFEASEV